MMLCPLCGFPVDEPGTDHEVVYIDDGWAHADCIDEDELEELYEQLSGE